jgi:tetratricopeptide (TPR) repeat protein
MDDENTVEQTETRGIGLGWRVAVGVVAIVLVGVLGYPFIQDFLNKAADTKAIIAPEVKAVVAAPLATAQADPDSVAAHFELGKAYYEAGQWELAASAYQKVIELDPAYQAAYTNLFELGNAYYEAGQWELAAGVYQKVIELDPAYQAAYANLGATYYQQQRFDLAITQYEKALELKPEDGESAYNLGAIYLQQALSQGEQPDPASLKQAIDQIQKALQISPKLAEPHFSLGVAYMTLNRRTEAIQAFETFLSLDTAPNSRARQAAQQHLQTLQGQ